MEGRRKGVGRKPVYQLQLVQNKTRQGNFDITTVAFFNRKPVELDTAVGEFLF